MDILEHRISVVDHLFYGSVDSKVKSVDINERLSQLELSLGECEVKVPDIRVCHDMVKQMKLQNVIITNSKQQVLELLTKKDELLGTISKLHEIQKLEKYANLPMSHDMSRLCERLFKLEQRINEQTVIVQAQSKQLDSFLDIYHELVNLFSDKCVEMNLKLTTIENKK